MCSAENSQALVGCAAVFFVCAWRLFFIIHLTACASSHVLYSGSQCRS
jgi:hypothetical protein